MFSGGAVIRGLSGRWLAPRRRLDPGHVREHRWGTLTIRNPPCCRSPPRRTSVPCTRSRSSPSLPPPRKNAVSTSISMVPASPTPSPPSPAVRRADLAGGSRRVLPRRHQERRTPHRCDRVLRPRGRGATRVSDQACRSRRVEMRFQSGQLEAYLTDGLWLRLASRANAAMARLAGGLRSWESNSSCPRPRTWRLPRSIRPRSIGWKPTGCSCTA